jgi:hypothetical protein
MDLIKHTINGYEIILYPAGDLSFNGNEFTPNEVRALFMFLQAPDVAAMITAADNERHEQPVKIKRPVRTAAERAARLDGFYGTINAWLKSQGFESELDDEIDRMIAVGDVPADVVRTAWATASLTPPEDTMSAVSEDMP